MKRHNWSPSDVAEWTLTLCLLATLVVGGAIGTATAGPAIIVTGGHLEASETVVGDDLNVTVRLVNVGSDGGGFTVDIKRNGTKIASERVLVPGDSEKRVVKTVTFDEPGTYRITAGDKQIGIVRVKRASTRITDETDASRSVEIRAAGIPTTDPYAIDLPAAENRTFSVERWTVEASNDSFTQELTEYTTPSASPVTLPDDENASVVALLTVDSTDGVDAATMRFTVDRSALRSAGIGAEELTVYTQDGTTWTAVETTVVEEGTDTVRYEARTSEFATLAVGSIEPEFAVEGANLRSVDTADGQRIVVETVVSNDGSVDGDYEAALTVNGELTNTSIVAIPAGEQRTVTLSHDVTAAGSYDVALNGRGVGSVVITEGQVRSETAEDTETATRTDTEADDSAGGDGSGGDGLLPPGVPATVLGIDTVLVAGGVAVALVVFFGALALMARGGKESGSDFEL